MILFHILTMNDLSNGILFRLDVSCLKSPFPVNRPIPFKLRDLYHYVNTPGRLRVCKGFFFNLKCIYH